MRGWFSIVYLQAGNGPLPLSCHHLQAHRLSLTAALQRPCLVSLGPSPLHPPPRPNSLQLDALNQLGWWQRGERGNAEVRSWHKDGWQQAPEVWKGGKRALMTRGMSLSPPWAFKPIRYSRPPPATLDPGPQERHRGQFWEAEPGPAALPPLHEALKSVVAELVIHPPSEPQTEGHPCPFLTWPVLHPGLPLPPLPSSTQSRAQLQHSYSIALGDQPLWTSPGPAGPMGRPQSAHMDPSSKSPNSHYYKFMAKKPI